MNKDWQGLVRLQTSLCASLCNIPLKLEPRGLAALIHLLFTQICCNDLTSAAMESLRPNIMYGPGPVNPYERSPGLIFYNPQPTPPEKSILNSTPHRLFQIQAQGARIRLSTTPSPRSAASSAPTPSTPPWTSRPTPRTSSAPTGSARASGSASGAGRGQRGPGL